ncbi:MAG TPA: hypothetical protein PLG17_12665, partial [Thermodesulfobacteriota bacterium]|nr:hypothetical protein [Thermodesulfobacteriota bacterium]
MNLLDSEHMQGNGTEIRQMDALLTLRKLHGGGMELWQQAFHRPFFPPATTLPALISAAGRLCG